MRFLSLVAICFEQQRALLDPLAASLELRFRMPVRTTGAWFDADLALDSDRGQYNSTLLIRQLLEGLDQDCSKTLGVIAMDLFIPVLTYVFGEAQLDGAAALVSTFRLRSEAYGLEPDEGLLFTRLEKESFHELGHTYGLVHCPAPQCVMHASTYVEQIDLKTREFCPGCAEELCKT